MRKPAATLLAVVLTGATVPALGLGGGGAAFAAAAPDPSVVGSFALPFAPAGPKCTLDLDKKSKCKPAAATTVILPNGKILYWDALEGEEDIRLNEVAQGGDLLQNDQAQVLDLGGGTPTFTPTTPFDGGSNPTGNPDADYLPGPLHNNDNLSNDGDLFCSDQLFLSNGTVLDAGGTDYYQEPGIPGLPDFGVVELEGLDNSKVFDPATNTWTEKSRMNHGRWYPSLVTLGDGNVFVASGVRKLLKPVYPDHPGDSGTNVVQTETYDTATGKWTDNGKGAEKSLPLFPRIHLLPDGHVYYDAGGQTFNPFGQSYDEALWNFASSYDPASKTWTDLGIPQIAGLPLGFRGSAFSQMLTLKAPYTTAQFLSGGGVLGVSPGTYVATNTSTLNTVTMGSGTEKFHSQTVGPMNNARWYSSAVTLPTGQVLAFSGADRDEVVLPGTATPVQQAEMYDPATKTWSKLAYARHGRTYHNTAALLPDGRVLVAGHSPINTGYAFQINGPRTDVLGLSDAFRDPSFEIFSPPNLFYGPRPVITDVSPAVDRGRSLTVAVNGDPADIAGVVLVRNTAITHLVDADQRVVDLPVTARGAHSVTVTVTGNSAVLPSGPYELFVNKSYAKGLTPSVSRQVFVGYHPTGEQLAQLTSRASAQTAAELATAGTTLTPSAPAFTPPSVGPLADAVKQGGQLLGTGLGTLGSALAPVTEGQLDINGTANRIAPLTTQIGRIHVAASTEPESLPSLPVGVAIGLITAVWLGRRWVVSRGH